MLLSDYILYLSDQLREKIIDGYSAVYDEERSEVFKLSVVRDIEKVKQLIEVAEQIIDNVDEKDKEYKGKCIRALELLEARIHNIDGYHYEPIDDNEYNVIVERIVDLIEDIEIGSILTGSGHRRIIKDIVYRADDRMYLSVH